jgi:hypothetical protein
MGRERLANRRGSVSFDFEHKGVRGFALTYSKFADGRVAEVFIQNCKTDSAADVNARDGAIVLSFALQFGADLSAIAKALCRDSQGRPSGVMGTALDLLLKEKAGS